MRRTLAELDRGDADAAGGAKHQQALALLDVGAILQRHIQEVLYIDENADAWSNGMPSGIGNRRSADTATFSAMPPWPISSSRDRRPSRAVTSEPTLATVPAISVPGANGRGGFV